MRRPPAAARTLPGARLLWHRTGGAGIGAFSSDCRPCSVGTAAAKTVAQGAPLAAARSANSAQLVDAKRTEFHGHRPFTGVRSPWMAARMAPTDRVTAALTGAASGGPALSHS